MDSLPPDLYYQFAGAPATANVVFNQTPQPAAGATITVNGIVLAYGTDFNLGTGAVGSYSAIICARRFAERINGISDDSRFSLSKAPNADMFARVAGNTVYLFSRIPGTSGNNLTLATSNSAAFTISGGTFAGGSSGNSSIAVGGQSVAHHEILLGASATQIIPIGAKGWTVSVLTGTATVGSAAALPAGFSDNDPNTLTNTLTITTAAASSAYVRWNT